MSHVKVRPLARGCRIKVLHARGDPTRAESVRSYLVAALGTDTVGALKHDEPDVENSSLSFFVVRADVAQVRGLLRANDDVELL